MSPCRPGIPQGALQSSDARNSGTSKNGCAGLFSVVCGRCMSGLDGIHNIEHDENEMDGRCFWDDTSGEVLDSSLTWAARAEEVEAIRKIGVYRKVPIAQCVVETGKKPIGTRWVDTNKGDATNPKVRSRLVAQEIHRSKMPELFAATPPHWNIYSILYPYALPASGQQTLHG